MAKMESRFILAFWVLALSWGSSPAWQHGPNAAGTTIEVTSYADGFKRAPGAAIQYPALLDAYRVRPPWNVAGVDYAVGPPGSTTFKDAATGALPSGVTRNAGTKRFTVDGNNVTLDAWDFTDDWSVVISGRSTNTTITNSKFKLLSDKQTPIIALESTSDLTVRYVSIDGNNFQGQTVAVINYQGGGTVTVEYSHIHNAGSDFFSFARSTSAQHMTVVVRYNLIENNGMATGTHPDWMQFGGGTFDNVTVTFNTAYQHFSTAGTQGFFVESIAPGTVAAAEVAYNTLIAVGRPLQVSAFMNFASTKRSTCAAHHNYADPTSARYFARSGSSSACTFSSNVNMVAGAAFRNSPRRRRRPTSRARRRIGHCHNPRNA